MEEKLNVKIGEKYFLVEVDFDELKQLAAERRSEYDPEENCFVELYSENPTTQEQWDADCNQMDADILAIQLNPQILEVAINRMNKKNDGWFKKGSVSQYNQYEHLCSYWEESYGYNTSMLRLKATSAVECTLSLTEIVIGY